MKIVVLDGYTENPGDLSWSALEQLGELVVYDRTSYEESDLVAERIGDADVAIMNKTPISKAAKDLGVEFVELDDLFARSDVLGLQMPLMDFNTGIINKENIAKMKDGVIIINNSRGQMVVEQDLADALNSGKVACAGLDVVSTEPIRADNPLLKAKNCIITPHMSWGSRSSRQRIMDCTVENVRAFLAGQPQNVVNK